MNPFGDTPGLVFGGDHTPTANGGPSVISRIGIEDNMVEDDYEVAGRQCVPFQVDYCRKLPYNFTSFPNAMGHMDVHEAKYDIERFQ